MHRILIGSVCGVARGRRLFVGFRLAHRRVERVRRTCREHRDRREPVSTEPVDTEPVDTVPGRPGRSTRDRRDRRWPRTVEDVEAPATRAASSRCSRPMSSPVATTSPTGRPPRRSSCTANSRSSPSRRSTVAASTATAGVSRRHQPARRHPRHRSRRRVRRRRRALRPCRCRLSTIDPADHICNGATDNGAGVAAAIVAARDVRRPAPRRTVVVAFWDAEEDGLLGSSTTRTIRSFPWNRPWRTSTSTSRVRSPPVDRQQHDRRRSGDRWADDRRLGDDSRGESSTLDTKLLSVIFGQGRSDHVNFIANGVPAVFLTDATNACYHTTQDDVTAVDFDKLDQQVVTATALLADLASTDAYPCSTRRRRSPRTTTPSRSWRSPSRRRVTSRRSGPRAKRSARNCSPTCRPSSTPGRRVTDDRSDSAGRGGRLRRGVDHGPVHTGGLSIIGDSGPPASTARPGPRARSANRIGSALGRHFAVSWHSRGVVWWNSSPRVNAVEAEGVGLCVWRTSSYRPTM